MLQQQWHVPWNKLNLLRYQVKSRLVLIASNHEDCNTRNLLHINRRIVGRPRLTICKFKITERQNFLLKLNGKCLLNRSRIVALKDNVSDGSSFNDIVAVLHSVILAGFQL